MPRVSLPCGAGLAAVAGALAGVADGAGGQVQDLVRVVAGQGHLGGAHEVQVVFGETVDLGVVLYIKAGALHGLGAHQRGRDHGDEAGLDGLVHGHLQQRHLQARTHAAQEVEAGAGNLGAAFHVDRADQLTDFQVVLGLEVGELAGRADGLDHDVVVLAALRDAVLNEVGDAAQQFVLLGLRGVGLGGGGLDRVGQFLDLGQQGLLLLALGLRHLLAEDVLLGAEVFEADQGGPAGGVCGDDRVHH